MISQQVIYTNIIKRLKEQGYENFTDYFEGSTGRQQISIGASLVDMMQFSNTITRRECYLPSAKLLTSLYNIAANLGYVPNRANPVELTFGIDSTIAKTYSKFNTFATIGNLPLSLIEDITTSIGVMTVKAVVGEWKTKEFTIAEQTTFGQVWMTGNIPNISQDYLNISVNNVQVNVCYYADEMDTTNVLIQNLGTHLLLRWGDGTTGLQLNVNDKVVISYIEVKGPLRNQGTNPVITPTGLRFIPHTVNVKKRWTPADPASKIATVAPAFRRAKKQMLTPSDYSAMIASYPGIASAYVTKQELNGRYDACVTYCTTTETELTVTELNSLKAFLQPHLYVVSDPTFNLGTAVNLHLKLHIAIDNVDKQEIRNDLLSYLDLKVLQLGTSFSPYDLLEVIRDKVVRTVIETPVSDYQLDSCQYFKVQELDIVWYSKGEVISVVPNDTGYKEDEIPANACCQNLREYKLPVNLNATLNTEIIGSLAFPVPVYTVNAELVGDIC